ncbi:glycosyltransferase [Pseudomonas sp. GD03842]|uniref:RHS repeat-associated core domain-containing protein n=1 Tax=Pseudomonas sp. GD03842 TaxID=2975385 RepID=UPI00244AE55E|nr:RHS repeat-associated core domain-containing protein [Pseudomonas sp. GD03842]MDH0746227.1 glycosyltransferase [Pseudomonas sp. GD03842]
MSSLSRLHAHTPTLTVNEPRGLPIRAVSFYRSGVDALPSERVDRSAFDASSRLVFRWDPRLWIAANGTSDAPSNLHNLHSLSGRVLLTDSVDAGCAVELLNEAGARACRWGAKDHVQRVEHDGLLRPVAIFEGEGSDERCLERMSYGGADLAERNQCGQLIRHDDPAGSLFNEAFAITGGITQQARRFLTVLDTPDWPEALNERDALLEAGEGYPTRWQFSATGDAIRQTDAMGHLRLSTFAPSGLLKGSHLQLVGQAVQALSIDVTYDAQGRVESETAGNGVVTSHIFDKADSRLLNLRVDDGRLQDLHYAYDPVGNVLSIEDKAQPTRYFANQQIEPLRTFAYDSLYQLINATGYESAVASRGPDALGFSTAADLRNYTQHYEYDAGGNLQKMVHTGAQNHTRLFSTARYSNRTLLQTGDQPPSEENIAQGFDAAGNLRELAPGQRLSWDVRNQISEVTPVKRESGVNDHEVYRYDAAGERLRKVRVIRARAVTHVSEVRYLPGLEIRTIEATGEALQIVVAEAEGRDVRVLHWEAGRPANIDNDQVRYSLKDHLGSSTLELDQAGQRISQEAYYPYGETAWFAARSEVEATYKTVRYSGKERDATGLYYYGLRYYAPWLMRWINPDPMGEVGTLNLYKMVNNSPLVFVDNDGQKPEIPKEIHYIWIGKSKAMHKYFPNIKDASVLNPQYSVRVHLDLGTGDTGFEKIKEQFKDSRNVSVTRLREEPFFLDFARSPSYQAYSDLFGDDPRNYASATDVLRYSMINHYGGIYVDMDDEFRRGIRSDDFAVKKNRVFTMSPVNPPWAKTEYVINNNAFASHRQNSALNALIDEVSKAYQARETENLGVALSAMPSSTADEVSAKLKIVSDVTGPAVFTRVLTRHDPKLRKLFEATIAFDQGGTIKNRVRHRQQLKKRMPMRQFLSIGSAHSWL